MISRNGESQEEDDVRLDETPSSNSLDLPHDGRKRTNTDRPLGFSIDY
jgi:hypothetical protein